jgi:hypothetical protein
MQRRYMLVAMLGIWSGSAAQAQAPADRAAVERASLDYLEGFYEGDTAKLIRSVRPDVYKIGFWRHRDSTQYGTPRQMPWPGWPGSAAAG